MNRPRFAALLLCTLFSSALFDGAARAAISDYAYAWPLYTEGGSAAWQVELTPEVYAAIGTQDLRDVEVVNAAGESVPIAPYRTPPATGSDQASFVDVPVFALPAAAEAAAPGDAAIQLHIERGADGRLRRLDADVGAAGAQAVPAGAGQLLLDASSLHAPLATLRIGWDRTVDASVRFAIDASDDLQHWRGVVGDATVLHLRQDNHELVRSEVPLNGTSAAYLRLRRLDQGVALPGLHVGVGVLVRSTPAAPARQWLQASLDGSDTRHLDRSTRGDGTRPVAYRYHLPAALPAAGLKIELADDNSLVAGRALSSAQADDAKPAWTLRSEFVAFRLRQGDAVATNDEFPTYPASRARDWRVELDTPLDHAPAVSVAYRPDRFVFLAQGAGPYRLVAGSARARRGDYPIDTALAQLRASQGADWQPPLTRLGARELLQGDRALLIAAPATPAHDWRTWLLWAVLVAAVAVVGGLALSLLRKG